MSSISNSCNLSKEFQKAASLKVSQGLKAFFSTLKKIETFIHGSPINVDYGYAEHLLYGIGSQILVPVSILIHKLKEPPKEGESNLVVVAHKVLSGVALIFATPLLGVGVVMKGIGALMPVYVGDLDSTDMKKTSPERVDQLYDLADIFHQVAMKHGVKYSIESGTLLGALRSDPSKNIEGGIIPWDDDIDAFAMSSEKEKIDGMKEELAERGVILKNPVGQPFNYHLSFTDEVRKAHYGEESEVGHMDLFLYNEIEGRITYADEILRHNFPKWHLKKEDMEELECYDFGPAREDGTKLKLWGVKKSIAIEVVERYYGKGCLWEGVKTHSHINLLGISLPVPGLQRAKYKITTSFAEGNKWKKLP